MAKSKFARAAKACRVKGSKAAAKRFWKCVKNKMRKGRR